MVLTTDYGIVKVYILDWPCGQSLGMIGQLRGNLLDKTPPWVLLDVAGVGYELQVPLGTLCALPNLGTPCTLHTHLVVREDGHHLYGFGSSEEKLVFKTLIKISGIGPRTALAILSSMTPLEFMLAIQEQNPAQLVRVPGIGKKTAERVLLELKEIKSLHPLKAHLQAPHMPNGGPEALASLPSQARIRAEIEQALCALGYSEKEALHACFALPEDCTTPDGLRLALRHLSKP